MSICCFRCACLWKENEVLNSVAVRFFINSALSWRQSCQIHLVVFALFQVCWCSLLLCGCIFFFHGFEKTGLEFVYRGKGREAVQCFCRKSNLKVFSSYLFLAVRMWLQFKDLFFPQSGFSMEWKPVGCTHIDLWLCTEIHLSFPISWSGRSNCG